MWQATSSPWAHQHTTALNFSYFKFSINKYHRNYLPFFFLPKLICEKASAPKQIAVAGVRWCENGKITPEDTIPCQKIKTQPWETLPLRRKTKTHCSLNPRKTSSVSDLPCKSTGTVARKRKSHTIKRHPKSENENPSLQNINPLLKTKTHFLMSLQILCVLNSIQWT